MYPKSQMLLGHTVSTGCSRTFKISGCHDLQVISAIGSCLRLQDADTVAQKKHSCQKYHGVGKQTERLPIQPGLQPVSQPYAN